MLTFVLLLGWCWTTTSLSPPVLFQHDRAGSLGVPVILDHFSCPSLSLLPSPPRLSSKTFTVLFTANQNKSQSGGCQNLMMQILSTTTTTTTTTPTVLARCGASIPSTEKQIFTGFTDMGGTVDQPLFLGEGSGTWGHQNKFMGIYTTSSSSSSSSSSTSLQKVVDTTNHLPTGEIIKVLCCGRVATKGDVIFGGASAYDGEGIEGKRV